MRIWDIFYYYYAAISDWSQQMRIALNLAVASLLLFFFLRVTYPVWRPFSIRIGIGLRKIFYLVVSDFYYESRIKAAMGSERYARLRERQNTFSANLHNKDEKKRRILKQIKEKKRKLKLRFIFLLYGLGLLLVFVPSMPGLKVPKALQVVYGKYDCLEQEALAKARIIQEKEEREARETTQAEQKDENASLEFLQLTKLGESGAYLRKKPDKEAKVEAVLKGQVRMEKIKADDENNPAWFKVKLEDGRKGWIHASIVEAAQE